MVSGTKFNLINLHRNGNTIAWDIEGLMINKDERQPTSLCTKVTVNYVTFCMKIKLPHLNNLENSKGSMGNVR